MLSLEKTAKIISPDGLIGSTPSTPKTGIASDLSTIKKQLTQPTPPSKTGEESASPTSEVAEKQEPKKTNVVLLGSVAVVLVVTFAVLYKKFKK